MTARSDFETLRFKVKDGVAWVRLNRPDRLNAFTPQMWAEMRTLGRELLADPGDIRVLVVSGEGRAFSSGIDTSVFAEGLSVTDLGDDEPPRHENPSVNAILTAQDAYNWLAARGTRMGLLELQYGILPDLGGTQRLPRIVGIGKAIELISTAAKIDADEALRIGLVERVVSDEELWETADDLAATIAAQPPLAVRGAKRAVHAALDGRSVRDGLLVEAEGQAVCITSNDFREAISAFVEARPPVYTAS
jgi:enoyl-CoA hydratase